MNETAPVETLAALCAGESFGRSVEISTPHPPPRLKVSASSRAVL